MSVSLMRSPTYIRLRQALVYSPPLSTASTEQNYSRIFIQVKLRTLRFTCCSSFWPPLPPSLWNSYYYSPVSTAKLSSFPFPFFPLLCNTQEPADLSHIKLSSTRNCDIRLCRACVCCRWFRWKVGRKCGG